MASGSGQGSSSEPKSEKQIKFIIALVNLGAVHKLQNAKREGVWVRSCIMT